MGFFKKKQNKKNNDFIGSYDVIYRKGHPDYPDFKVASINLKVSEEALEFRPTVFSKSWFKGLNIPYNRILNLRLGEKEIGTNLKISDDIKINYIHIIYEDELGELINILFEMSSGGMLPAKQGKKCDELYDILVDNDIEEKFK